MKMKLVIDVLGHPTREHCSQTSSVNKCQFLNCGKEKCSFFKVNLEYDYEAHAYKRCENCKLDGYFDKEGK